MHTAQSSPVNVAIFILGGGEDWGCSRVTHDSPALPNLNVDVSGRYTHFTPVYSKVNPKEFSLPEIEKRFHAI